MHESSVSRGMQLHVTSQPDKIALRHNPSLSHDGGQAFTVVLLSDKSEPRRSGDAAVGYLGLCRRLE